MSVFFSKTTLGFYPEEDKQLYINAGTWPTDAIAVSDEQVSEYTVSHPTGKTLGSDDEGMPVWVDLPPKTTEELIEAAQSKITQLLAAASEKIAPLQDAVDLAMATTEETALLTAWKTYRVLVNRTPTQSGYPDLIDWPQMPE